jgi:hypothetical protein
MPLSRVELATEQQFVDLALAAGQLGRRPLAQLSDKVRCRHHSSTEQRTCSPPFHPANTRVLEGGKLEAGLRE